MQYHYVESRKHTWRPCKHCGVMVSRDTAAIRYRGEHKKQDKYYTNECDYCRIRANYKWRNERKRKGKN